MMTTTTALDFPRPATLPRPFVIALASSVAAHAVAAWLLPAMQHHADELPQPLVVSLRALPRERIAPPAPAVAAIADLAAAKPVPLQKPLPRPAVAAPQPAAPARVLTSTAPTAAPFKAATPTAVASTPAVVPAAAPAAPPSAVIAQAAVPAASPAPQPESKAATVQPEAPDPAALARYGRQLSDLFAQQRQYPRLAAMRGWQGEVQVRITVARKGAIVAAIITHSSGFEVLDQNALALVQAAGPLPALPDSLQGREFQIVIPVFYKLEKAV